MRLLLDTHALLWWLMGNEAMPLPVRAVIDDPANEVFVSAASVWEIATKHRLGKLPRADAIAQDIEAAILSQGFTGLPVSLRHAQVAGGLAGPHRDPFDRMLIAQAMLEGLVLVSNEQAFDVYGVRRLW